MPHSEIFENPNDLPTFNSQAIELNINRIPGLSDKFIFMNDDFFFGEPVTKEDFCYNDFGQKLRMSWPIHHCVDGCPIEWVGDGTCHKACNVSGCAFDQGDCEGVHVQVNKATSFTENNPWHRSLPYLAGILNQMYGFQQRKIFMHSVHFWDVKIINEMKAKFRDLVTDTTAQKFRSSKDIERGFLYYNFLVEESKLMNANGEQASYRHQIYQNTVVDEGEDGSDFIFIFSDPTATKASFDGKEAFAKFGCLNDNTGNLGGNQVAEIQVIVDEFLSRLYPLKSRFEK